MMVIIIITAIKNDSSDDYSCNNRRDEKDIRQFKVRFSKLRGKYSWTKSSGNAHVVVYNMGSCGAWTLMFPALCGTMI